MKGKHREDVVQKDLRIGVSGGVAIYNTVKINVRSLVIIKNRLCMYNFL